MCGAAASVASVLLTSHTYMYAFPLKIQNLRATTARLRCVRQTHLLKITYICMWQIISYTYTLYSIHYTVCMYEYRVYLFSGSLSYSCKLLVCHVRASYKPLNQSRKYHAKCTNLWNKECYKKAECAHAGTQIDSMHRVKINYLSLLLNNSAAVTFPGMVTGHGQAQMSEYHLTHSHNGVCVV